MPRENRKRGKKHKKKAEDYTEQSAQYENPAEENEAGPSWIVSAPANAAFNEEAPFGYVDSEVKAYFRTVDVQIKEWQEVPPEVTEGDPNEDRRLFFVAALTEMSGKEKELATDPDCSTILERMAYSMDDFVRRVFMDRLTGSYKTLVKHRFASHVCQTFLEVAGDTVARETRGIIPPPPNEQKGELLLMTDMISDICEELLPDFTNLLMDPFASHVCRALLALLMPNLFPVEQKASTLRSKKSAAFKARQGPMKSLFNGNHDAAVEKAVPSGFAIPAERFMKAVRETVSANEVRALAASQVASPILQMLLEIEAARDLANKPGSLVDRVLDGLITHSCEGSLADLESSDYVGTLLRDPTSSHLLETIVRRLSPEPFGVVWDIYLKCKLHRLSVHPVANFVVGKALERVNEVQFQEACEELGPVSEKLFKQSRTGLIRAMVDRAAQLSVHDQTPTPTVIDIIFTGLGLSNEEDKPLLVPCLLRLLPKDEYQKAKASRKPKAEGREPDRPNKRRHEPSEDPMAPKTQGALILQSLLRLPAPYNQAVLDSIYALSMEEVITMAHDITGSRVFDVILTSPSVPFKEKRKFVMHFIGHYHELVDDRIGSRVGDNCWAFADPYLKEKIARSLIPHERALAGSFYGKFFAKNLNLYLLQRNPEQWKNLQTTRKSAPSTQSEKQTEEAVSEKPAEATDVVPAQTQEDNKRKRKTRPADEIDQLFEEKLGKKTKKAELKTEASANADNVKVEVKKEKKRRRKDDDEGKDKGLDAILGAIKAAPKDEKRHHHKKKKAV